MELQTLRLRSFRSIADSGELRLRPLTLLVGPNESGKSSLLHAVAMLKQSLEGPDPAAPLLENGRLVQTGAFRQFVYRHETSRPVTVELGIGAGDTPASGLQAEIGIGSSVRRKSAYLQHFELREPGKTPMLSVSADAAGKIVHAEISEDDEAPAEPRILGTIARTRCLFHPTPAWDRWNTAAGRPISEFAASPRFFDRCEKALAALDSTLRRAAYLGPERAPVPTVAQIVMSPLPDVGARGENVAALLHAHRYADEAAPAMHQAAAWLERLEIGRHLRVIPIEEHLYELTLEEMETGLVMNPSEAGRAAQQLFPLLVQCALAEPGATLLLEEPEAHLDARRQSALADILVETVRSGRRLLVETYSELLMARIQELIREGVVSVDDVAFYSVNKVDDASQFVETPTGRTPS